MKVNINVEQLESYLLEEPKGDDKDFEIPTNMGMHYKRSQEVFLESLAEMGAYIKDNCQPKKEEPKKSKVVKKEKTKKVKEENKGE